MDNVVVGACDSVWARAAVRWAAERAFAERARLEVVTAVPLMVTGGAVGSVACLPDRLAMTDAVVTSQHALIEEELGDPGRRPRIQQTIGFGDLFSVLHPIAVTADLVVLGLGSARRPNAASRRCLRHLACPVVIVADGRPR